MFVVLHQSLFAGNLKCNVPIVNNYNRITFFIIEPSTNSSLVNESKTISISYSKATQPPKIDNMGCLL